jgi:hypothetical protein
MDEDRFWQIIDETRGDPDEQEVMLQDKLRSLSKQEVFDFDDLMERHIDQLYRWDVWAAAYTLGGGCGDDMFDDFRSCVVSRGRSFFEKVLKNPDNLADVKIKEPESKLFFEGLQWVAAHIYQEKTGQYPKHPAYVPPEGPTGEAWEEDSDDLARICPRLWEKYGWGENN